MTARHTGALGGNAAHLRRQNLERLLSIVINQAAPFTRGALVEATGLSAPTVGSLVAHLMRSGIVRSLGAGPSRGGRRPASLEFDARHGYIGAIDLGPTRTRLAVADLRGEVLAGDVVDTPSAVSPQAQLARLAAALRGVMDAAGLPQARLIAAGAGAPGAVSWPTGVVTFAPNLGGWSQVPMQELLQRELGVPVVVENDVNLAILGERWRGAARGHETCAYITIGTGIGAGIIVDGVLHRGHHFTAGEIAFMCMGPQFVDTRPHRCLESLASLKALAETGPRSAQRDLGRWLTDALAGSAGNGQLRRALDEAARLIGIAVANLSVVVDPSVVVLAGALVAEGLPVLAEVRRIVARVVPAPPKVVVSALGKEAPLWGCLLIAADEARARLRHQLAEAASLDARRAR